jgi:hypothetical protein
MVHGKKMSKIRFRLEFIIGVVVRFWIKNKMPRMAEMNRTTWFRMYRGVEEAPTTSAIFIRFGDGELSKTIIVQHHNMHSFAVNNTEHEIPTAGLTCDQLEEVIFCDLSSLL